MRAMKFVAMTLVMVVALMMGQSASAAGQPELYLGATSYTPFGPGMGIETIEIKNGGTDNADQFRVVVLDDASGQTLYVFGVPKLQVGTSITFQYFKSCRGRERIVVDAGNEVKELDETNNISVIIGSCKK